MRQLKLKLPPVSYGGVQALLAGRPLAPRAKAVVTRSGTSQDGTANFVNFANGTAIHQLWYEDATSLARKYRLAVRANVRGVGMWLASGRWPDRANVSDRDIAAMWQSIRENFSNNESMEV